MAKKEIKKSVKIGSNTKKPAVTKPAPKKPAPKKPVAKQPAPKKPAPKPAAKPAAAQPVSKRKAELENQLKALVKNYNENQLEAAIKQIKSAGAAVPANKPVSTPVNKPVSAQPAGKASVIDILPGDNNANFVIRIDNCRKFFTRDDFRKVVKVCQGTEKDVEKAGILYRWFLKERKDFLLDNAIKESKDRKISDFINIVKSKYTTKS